MSVTVVKDGPHFSSGSISFGSLRSIFKETNSGPIRASELRRNTDNNAYDPIVPDSSENENISTGSNLRLSQFRNSVKRYRAYQTGVDDNSHGRTEPGFRIGLLNLYGKGIDWSGGGYNGRDGQGRPSGSVPNLSKNIQKFVYIQGTCGSIRTDQPAAQLSPAVPNRNVRIEVSGSILGQGGLGGYNPVPGGPDNPSGENGGPAFNLDNGLAGGQITPVFVLSSARIYGGGGGGEQGKNGSSGSQGTCIRDYSVSSCGSTPSCSSGGSLIFTGTGPCCQYQQTTTCVPGTTCTQFQISFLGCVPTPQSCTTTTNCIANRTFGVCRISQPSTTPTRGIGGPGGNGQGYTRTRTSGSNSLIGPTCPTCPSDFTLSGGSCGTDGQRGGDGGDWGSDGQETPRGPRGTRGRGGVAMAGNGYRVSGSINSSTIKGSYNP